MNAKRIRIDRRCVLKGGLAAMGGVALFGGPAAAASRFLARPEGVDDEAPILVVLQLAGGNDGLNTIVPFQDDVYHRSRKIAVDRTKLLPLDDYRGFHPLLGGMRELYERGELAIVEGVGYAQPNRSHFASFDIWHAASMLGKAGGDGWLARLAAAVGHGDERDTNLAVHVGDRAPYSLFSRTASTVCFNDPELYRWNENEGAICSAAELSMPESAGGMTEPSAPTRVSRVRSTFLQARESSAAIRAAAAEYRPRVEYPDNRLGYAMKVCAALIQARIGARILSVELPGFDTHARQVGKHDYLTETWDGSLAAFLADLRGTPQGERTSVLVFSEFGRRVADNASGGTDHGTAGPTFVAGSKVRGGLYGKHPSLEDLDDGDLKFTTDFRSVYATLIQDWFRADAGAVLGGTYPTLPLFG
jgi:uncharacterized protein (DUF1501 family)